MPFYAAMAQPAPLKPPQYAPKSVIDSFTCYRDAVVWTWENRVNVGYGDDIDQSLCANFMGAHPPHMSRWVKRESGAPMKLDPDLRTKFQHFCGWFAVSQYMAKTDQITIMEQVLAERASA